MRRRLSVCCLIKNLGRNSVNVHKAGLDDLAALVRFTAAEAQEAEGATKDLTQLEIGIKTALDDSAV